METPLGEITLDKKRRLALGKVLKDKRVSSFDVYRTEEGYLLKPRVSIPAEEVWIFEDKKVKEGLQRGLSQEAKNNLGSFAKYAEED